MEERKVNEKWRGGRKEVRTDEGKRKMTWANRKKEKAGYERHESEQWKRLSLCNTGRAVHVGKSLHA